MLVTKMEELKKDVDELQKLLAVAQRPKVKDLLLIEIKKNETKISQLRDLQSKEEMETDSCAAAASTTTATSPSTSEPAKNKVYDIKLTNYAWDQSDKFIKIYLSLKDVHTLDKSNINCSFTPRTLELTVAGLNNRNYNFLITNLLEDIKPSDSYWKSKQDNIIIYLAKSHVGSKWQYMTNSEKKSQDAKLPKVEPGDDPTAGLMDMMKHMYDSGDDDMKRTIAKAWAESRDKQMTGNSSLMDF